MSNIIFIIMKGTVISHNDMFEYLIFSLNLKFFCIKETLSHIFFTELSSNVNNNDNQIMIM